ncbi:MAG TPA: hypothetical protein VIK89_15855 [Cytophagaceae bacterium]
MVRANALFIVVVISLIIGILTSSLILIAYHYRLQISDSLLYKRLELNANSGINLLLSDYPLPYDEPKWVDLFKEETDSILIKKSRWGVFEVGVVKASLGKSKVVKAIEYGYKPDRVSGGALYLVDQNRPLSLCGKTILRGTCYLPEAGVKRAYIEGQSFEGDKLVHGKTERSKTSLPPLNPEVQKYVVALTENPGASGIQLKEIDWQEQDSIINSFLDSTSFIHSSSRLNISGKVIKGNVIIYSSSQVELSADNFIKDALVIAPSIIVKRGFTGSVQLFGTDSIIIEEEVRLTYPSVVSLVKKDFKVTQPFIRIGSKAEVTGLVVAFQQVFDLKQTLIDLRREAKVEGQVYADGFLDLKGIVHGSVACNKFTLRTHSSTYENHLLNAVIDQTQLSTHYVGSSLVKSEKVKKIIKYLE